MDKIIVVLGGAAYAEPFKKFGSVECHYLESDEIDFDLIGCADLVVFTGGHDVHPSIYGEEKHSTTNSSIVRDMREAQVYKYCVAERIPMAGICRGSQFLTAMNGGKVVQHIANHATGHQHKMRYVSKKGDTAATIEVGDIFVTSTHHQMMYPWNIPCEEYKIIGYARHLSNWYVGAPKCEVELRMLSPNSPVMEPEVVWYYHTHCLAVQYHPEMMAANSDGWIYYQRLLEEYFFKKNPAV